MISDVVPGQKSTSGRRLAILLSGEVAEALRAEAFAGLKSLPRRGVEIGGILTKSARADSISMFDGLEIIPCEYLYGPCYRLSPADSEHFKTRVRELQLSGGVSAAGFFRSSTIEKFAVAPEDMTIVRESFSGVTPIFLVRPFPNGAARVRVFWPANNWSEFEEFELGNTLTPADEGEPSAPSAFVEHGTRKSEAPSVLPPTFTSRLEILSRGTGAWIQALAGTRGPVLWIIALLACVILARIAWVGVRERHDIDRPDLEMQVDVQARSLRLTWNRRLPAVRDAVSGSLLIDDGGEHRGINLDASQVAQAVIFYAPTSGDVTFRLQIRGHEPEQLSGTVRTILPGHKPATVQEKLHAGIVAPPLTLEPEQPISLLIPGRRASRPARQQPVLLATTPRYPEKSAQIRPNPSPAGSVEQKNPIPPFAVASDGPAESPLQRKQSAIQVASETILPAVPQDTRLTPAVTPALPQPEKDKPTERMVAAPAANFRSDSQAGLRIPSMPISAGIPVPARPLKQVIPATRAFGAPAVLSNMTISVQVRIDKSGHVIEARAAPNASRNSSVYWASRAVEAAKQWTFEPAKLHGESVPCDSMIEFHFAPLASQ